MTQRDSELEGWQEEWQALGGREGLARSLAERVQRDGRRLRRELVVEMAAAAGSTALCVWLLVDSQGKPVVAVACASVLLFTGVWVTRLLTLKQGSARADGNGLDAFIELTRRRLADDVKWHGFRRRCLPILTLLLVPWLIWAISERALLYGEKPWLAALELGALVALLGWSFVHLPRKVRALEAARDRFEALVDERTLR
jgi:hypothetical protein